MTATRVCKRDGNHTETETVAVTSLITKAATCEAMGETTYTSKVFVNSAFAVQTKKEEDISALGHDWSAPTYTWDEEQVTATRVCAHDAKHVETETVDSVLVLSLSPTETEAGEQKRISADFSNAAFTKQEIVVRVVPALETLNKPTFPSGLTTIEEEAFEGTKFQAVVVPETCTSIGSRAFANCSELVYVRIPASVTSIPSDAFEDCPKVIIDQQ